MNVIMPEGVTYILVIDTNQYAGNFERELCLYATGLLTPEIEISAYEQTILDSSGISKESFSNKSAILQNHEGRSVIEALRATPGRYNNGMGGHFDISAKKEGEKAFPAYESIAVFFNQPLTQDEINFVREKADKFAAIWQGGDVLKIKDVYQMQYKVEAVETPYVLPTELHPSFNISLVL